MLCVGCVFGSIKEFQVRNRKYNVVDVSVVWSVVGYGDGCICRLKDVVCMV